MSNLNEKQQEAVDCTCGPLLILAGAGTGKTTVITNRIANIINKNLANLSEILAVTFTNKAAGELKERVAILLNSPENSNDLWIGTFHSICLKILKMYPELAGLKTGFSIADTADQKQVIKKALKDLEIAEKTAPVKLVNSKISKLKENSIDIADESSISEYNQNGIDMTKIYPKYQELLRESNIVDFDDLILLTIKLLENQQVLSFFHEKFKYILVDEYQDTSKMQFSLISKFITKDQNICCVGDDDQSIYSWRGADITNILNFQKHFPNAKIITLHTNYRSTQAILDFANEIINQNTNRYDKNLLSNMQDQRSVKVIDTRDDLQESSEIAKIIANLKQSYDIQSNKDVAILVRAASQMRSIEEALIRASIPYKIIGGVKFYERKEIKDAISYIKLILSDSDVVSLERIINVPRRSIGDKTFENIRNFAHVNNLPILPALKAMVQEKLLSEKICVQVNDMLYSIDEARRNLHENKRTISDIIIDLLEDVGYMAMMRTEAINDPSYEKKIDNIEDLLGNIARFPNLVDFFDHIALISDAEKIDNDDVVNVMTMHASKGLEFDTVILPGWEEGLFPNQRVLDDDFRGLQEERRLAYVAATRAKRNLFILNARTRFLYGKYNHSVKSSFITSISHLSYDKIDATTGSTKNYLTYNTKFVQNIDEMAKKTPEIAKISENFAENSSKSSNNRVFHEKYGKGNVIKQIGNLLEIKFDIGARMIVKKSSVTYENGE